MIHIKRKLKMIWNIILGKPVMYKMNVVVDDISILTFDEQYGLDENRGGIVQDCFFHLASEYYNVNYKKEQE